MARSNPRASGRDMMISMAVLLVPVFIIIALFAKPGEEAVERVDYQSVLAQARIELPYLVLAPDNLPDFWALNRVRWVSPGLTASLCLATPGNSGS